MDITRLDAPATRPPEPSFTGDVLIGGYFRRPSPSRLAGAIVHFGHGARTPWKTNPTGQTVVVVEGAGRAQSAGGPVVDLAPGDVIWFAPGERHWEGAAPDAALVYVAVQEEAVGAMVSFDSAVTDDEYSATL